jgi:hypothetical protein
MYASRGSWGGGWGWEADVHLILQWAGLQPRILYEEGVVRDGLDAYRVLVLPNCDVLPQAVYERIRAFQRRGGLLIADSNLTPALMPDILLPPYHRTKQPRDDKQALQKLAADLWAQLAPVYRRYGESSDPDVVVRCRRYGTADYLFAINDKRTFGDYVGQHGLVMEKGVADSATLRVARPGAAVYDLRAHKAVAARPTADGVEWEAALGPGDGGLFLLLDRPLQEIRLTAPAAAAVGGRAEVVAEFADAGGTAVAAVLPVQIEILDPLGRSADGSGFHAAKDGRLALTLEFAPNDLAGAWRIRVTDLASGLAREAALTLTIGP